MSPESNNQKTSRLRTFGGWLIDPLQTHPKISEKRHAQLLAILTLVFIFSNLIGLWSTISMGGWSNSTLTLILLTILTTSAYALSRTQKHHAGAILFIASWNIGAYVTAYFTEGQPVGTINALLAFVFVMSSVLLTLKSIAILVGLNIAGFFILGLIFPDLSAIEIYTIAGTSGTLAVLVLVLTAYRNFLENQQLAEVQKINTELLAANFELSQNRLLLEQRILARTSELELRTQDLEKRSNELIEADIQIRRRAIQAETIAKVAQSIASIQNLQELLPLITQVISEQFNFYHTGIFLTDAANEYAVLSAANSEGGQRMLNRGHRLRIGQTGIVGYVVAAGKPRIVLDTDKDTVHYKNPDLPDTQSEMALPLRIGEKIIGALDVQSLEAEAFTEQDAEALSTLADQVSIAIQNSRLFETSQKSLAEVNTIYRQTLQETWSKTIDEQDTVGYRFSALGNQPLQEELKTKSVRQALSSGQMVVIQEAETPELATPIKVRGQIIGILNVRAPDGHTWKKSEISILQAIADRVASSAENARLFEETTSRAQRERTVSTITTKIRSTNDPDQMLAIALAELRTALNVKDIHIKKIEDPAESTQR